MVAKQRLHELIVGQLYSKNILNNSHRGDLVEMMVLEALGPDWRHVGLGWNLWDLQKGTGRERVRIQVKQCAARQLWGLTKKMSVEFSWHKSVPGYFRRDFPQEHIEDEGWLCDIFVVGIHPEGDESLCDQMDANQWRFMVIPTKDLKSGQKSMLLPKALLRWPLVEYAAIATAVNACIATSSE